MGANAKSMTIVRDLGLAAGMGLSILLTASIPARAQTVATPVWDSRPTADEALASFPPVALREHIGGEAAIKCSHDTSGVLTNCKVVWEYPQGQGFGAAALSLAARFQLNMNGPAARLRDIELPFLYPSQGSEPPSRYSGFPQSMKGYAGLAPAGPYWPERALRMGVGGSGTIDCHADDAGHLSGCRLVDDRPLSQNFAMAMLKMAERGWMTAAPVPDGVAPPADGYWRFKVSRRRL
jgi:hypothetical protein